MALLDEFNFRKQHLTDECNQMINLYHDVSKDERALLDAAALEHGMPWIPYWQAEKAKQEKLLETLSYLSQQDFSSEF